MRTSYEERFLLAVTNIARARGEAIVDAFARFAESPDHPSLEFVPMRGVEHHFTIKSRPGDVIVLRHEEPDLYIAVDVGPYAHIMRRWDGRRV